MDIQTKIDLVRRSPVEEIVTEADLKKVFENYAHPRHYIGFEISGMLHIGSGLCTTLKIQDFIAAGIKPTIFLADYHSYINEKLGGDLEKIQKVALGYFKHAFVSLGLDDSKVDYVLASEIYDRDYWKYVLQISKDTTLKRMMRCLTIMGRKESENTSCAGVVYPAMQAADIFKLNVQIAHAGMDQRKIHMLARELSHHYKKDFVAVHGHLLPGLQGPGRMNAPGVTSGPAKAEVDEKVEEEMDAKMSKSKPDSAIFIHDSEEQIKSKIKKAYCPEKVVEGNPIIEYAQYLVMREKRLSITRPAKFGGDLDIGTPEELKQIYLEGKLHPMDLKTAVANELSVLLKPSREYFEKNKQYLEQLQIKDITR
ncbi:tyrosine--tRNA ligase [Candidatus Micrarchaeota archaeon]|nr:tyrosine--tRNA ligase [Candidatus Micrarchaeota archaeon]